MSKNVNQMTGVQTNSFALLIRQQACFGCGANQKKVLQMLRKAGLMVILSETGFM
jgi:hypothetical protein